MATRIPRMIGAAEEVVEALTIQRLKEFAKQPNLIKEFLEESRKQGKIDETMTVEMLQNHISEFEDTCGVSVDRKYATGISLAATQRIYEELIQMNWRLCRAPSGVHFITSDCPLVCFVPRGNGSATLGGGFGLFDAQVTYPLSPTRCLFLVRKYYQNNWTPSKKFLKEVNRRTAWAAERIVISQTKNKYVERLTEWASGSLKQPKMDRERLIRGLTKRRSL